MKAMLDKLRGLFRPRPAAVPAAAVAIEYDPLDAMRNHVTRHVATGFYDRDEILQRAEDAFADEIDEPVLRRQAPAILDAALAAHLADQASWPAVTDCDRLDAAFADLEAEGIVARQNFTCCGTCGVAEIGDEAAELEQTGRRVEGYAFYHMQDTEAAAEGHGLYLNYGAAEEGPDAAVAIGHRIVRQLERHGLEPNWDGDIGMRIGLSLDWKRRQHDLASSALH